MSLDLSHLNHRDEERLIHFKKTFNDSKVVFLTCSSDLGVQLNGGRRGSEYGPRAILSILEKMTFKKAIPWCEVEVTKKSTSLLKMQENEKESMFETMKQDPQKTYIALGGGHDHVFPFLTSLEKIHPNKDWHIINIDAHLDTRTDATIHSGTPFRQWDQHHQKNYQITQLGIHDFSNSLSTRSPLKNGKQEIFKALELNQLSKTELKNFLEKTFPKNESTMYFLSLDADALSANSLEAVSAPNPSGLDFQVVSEIFRYFQDELKGAAVGVYEYNPLYDNLSCKGARTLAALLYPFLENS